MNFFLINKENHQTIMEVLNTELQLVTNIAHINEGVTNIAHTSIQDADNVKNSCTFHTSIQDADNFRNDILFKLDSNTRVWADQLSPSDIAKILTAVYRIPGLINSIYNSNNVYNNTLVSAEIGKRGELKFETICKKLPSNYHLTNTAKMGHAGDFIITFTASDRKLYSCLVDIKNYKTSVPKKEVDKFIHDLTYGNYDCGLIISLNSRFSNITEQVYIENKCLPHNTIPIMYLAKVSDELILQCIELICLKAQTTVEKTCKLDNVQNILTCINTSLSQSSTTRRLLTDMQINLNSQMNTCQQYLIGCESQIKQAIRNLETEIRESISIINNANQVTIPEEKERSDNVSDLYITPFPNLDIVESEIKTDIDDTFDFTNYNKKDIGSIQQIIDLNWTNIEQASNGYATFTTSDYKIEIKPLKSKTKIYVFEINYKLPLALTKIMRKKILNYEADLNQNIVNILIKLIK